MIADDHPAVTHMLGQLLEPRGYTVVCVGDGDSAIEAIELHRPDVAVLDVSMPRQTGLDVARAAARISPDTAVLLYTASAGEALLHEALEVGVRGLVLKNAPVAEVVRAIELVASGKLYVDPTLGASLIASGKKRPNADLTQREREVLRRVADGKTNDQIGAELFISPQTVRTYVRKAMAKLDADTRTQAVAEAIRQHLIA